MYTLWKLLSWVWKLRSFLFVRTVFVFTVLGFALTGGLASFLLDRIGSFWFGVVVLLSLNILTCWLRYGADPITPSSSSTSSSWGSNTQSGGFGDADAADGE